MLALSAVGSASFAPAVPVQPACRSSVPVRMGIGIDDLRIGVSVEAGGRIFDPMRLADKDSGLEFLGEDKLAWYRHAELKHGRIAMAAFVGYLVTAGGISFGGYLSPSQGLLFSDLLNADNPFKAWDMVPEAGKYQFYSVIAILEFLGESEQPHYTQQGGVPGRVNSIYNNLPPFSLTRGALANASPAKLEEKLNCEIKNGRLAMLGILSLLAENNIPGSVPFLKIDWGTPFDFQA